MSKEQSLRTSLFIARTSSIVLCLVLLYLTTGAAEDNRQYTKTDYLSMQKTFQARLDTVNELVDAQKEQFMALQAKYVRLEADHADLYKAELHARDIADLCLADAERK